MVDTVGNKTGGRAKGTPNKKTQNLIELIEKHHNDFDPILELINIYKDDKTQVDLKVNILKDITPYIYPRRKSVESSIAANRGNKSHYDLTKPIDELIKELKGT